MGRIMLHSDRMTGWHSIRSPGAQERILREKDTPGTPAPELASGQTPADHGDVARTRAGCAGGA